MRTPNRLHQAALIAFAVDVILFYACTLQGAGLVGQYGARAAAAGCFAVVLVRAGLMTREDLGLGRGRFGEDARWTLKLIAVLLGTTVVLMAAAIGIARLMGRPLALPRELASPSGIPHYLLTSVFMAPIMEEFVYRGLMARGLEAVWGRRGAIAAGAIVFYALHLVYARPPWMVHYLVGGAILTWVFLERRRLWICILLHAGGNVMVVLDDALAFWAPEVYRSVLRVDPSTPF